MRHCFEDGPLTDDGCPTHCMLANLHEGDHVWVRDDEIVIKPKRHDEPELEALIPSFRK